LVRANTDELKYKVLPRVLSSNIVFKILIEEKKCADPIMGNTTLQKGNEFQQAPIVSDILGFLGPNVFMMSLDCCLTD